MFDGFVDCSVVALNERNLPVYIEPEPGEKNGSILDSEVRILGAATLQG